MLNGNVYGLIITVLTFVIAIVLTMRQVERTGVHVELIIRPVAIAKLGDIPEHKVDNEAVRKAPEDEVASEHVTGKPPLTQ